MKRYIFIDWLRGFAIYLVVIAHALLFNVFEGISETISSVPPYLQIFYLPVSVLLSSAGLFAFISGITNGTIIYSLFKHKTPSRSILKDSLISNFSILIIHYVYLIFFTHSRVIDGVTYRSLITGTFELNGTVPQFDITMLFYNDALLMICMGGIISTILLLCFRKYVVMDDTNIIFTIFGGIGLLVVFISPLLRDLISSHFISAFNNEQYFLATILSWFVMPRHGILPYSFYSVFGAMLGLALVRKVSTNKILRWLLIGGSFFLIIGIIAIIIMGMPDTNLPIYPINLYLLTLSFIFFFSAFLINRFERPELSKQKDLVDKTINFRRMGMVGLTVYTLEGPVAAFVAFIFDTISQDIVHNLYFGVLIYLPLLLLFWNIVASKWEKYNFNYGIEWIIMKTTNMLRGRKSNKLNVQRNLRNPLA